MWSIVFVALIYLSFRVFQIVHAFRKKAREALEYGLGNQPETDDKSFAMVMLGLCNGLSKMMIGDYVVSWEARVRSRELSFEIFRDSLKLYRAFISFGKDMDDTIVESYHTGSGATESQVAEARAFLIDRAHKKRFWW